MGLKEGDRNGQDGQELALLDTSGHLSGIPSLSDVAPDHPGHLRNSGIS